MYPESEILRFDESHNTEHKIVAYVKLNSSIPNGILSNFVNPTLNLHTTERLVPL
jgi:hypothetical protein